MAPITLNVVVHGMFAAKFDNKNKHIILYTPNMPDGSHAYKAGNWKTELDLTKPRYYSKQYTLVPAPKNKKPHLRHSHIPVFPSKLANITSPKFTFVLPYPNRIIPLRSIERDNSCDSFFLGKPVPKATLNSVPLVVVFTYLNMTNPILKPLTSQQWAPDVKNGIANLHIWAMPPKDPGPIHPYYAFKQMKKMVGYAKHDLDINKVYVVKKAPNCDPDPAALGAYGVSSAEEKSLIERGGRHPLIANTFDCAALFLS